MQAQLIEATNGHFYQVGSEFYPSSTTILKRAYPMEIGLKMFLQNKTKQEADEILYDAGMSGTKVHHAIHLLFQGVELKPSGFTKEDIDNCGLVEPELTEYLRKPFNEKEDTCLRGFLNFCKDYHPAPKATELIVWDNKHKYAGTLDFLGVLNKKHKGGMMTTVIPAIIDWKTSKGIYKEFELQVASYWGTLPNPEKGTPYLVQLGVNKCGYRMIEVKDPQEKLDQFLNLKKTFDFLYPDYQPYNYEFLDKYKI